jgi:hypothetical protein
VGGNKEEGERRKEEEERTDGDGGGWARSIALSRECMRASTCTSSARMAGNGLACGIRPITQIAGWIRRKRDK